MRVTILAVGRLRSGAEAELVADYLARFDRMGRVSGLGPATVVELDERKDDPRMLEASLPRGAVLAALDERGPEMTSVQFAELMRRRAESGVREMAFAIGGADGLAPEVRARADHLVSFGRMVWPHMLARVMLAEQLYRAASILAGTPYHRGDV